MLGVWWWGTKSPYGAGEPKGKVRTASAMPFVIVSKSGGVRRIVEHLGSAHDETELEVLLEPGGSGDADFRQARGRWT